MIKGNDLWRTFHEIYGPGLLGGFFLCIADVMQSDHQGQAFKMGVMVKRSFFNFGLEEALVGMLLVLLLGLALCWVRRPKSRSDSFAKGASVFAVLAAVVPARELPGTPVVSSYTSPDKRSTVVARIESEKWAWEMLLAAVCPVRQICGLTLRCSRQSPASRRLRLSSNYKDFPGSARRMSTGATAEL
jgi:hypothetical protein